MTIRILLADDHPVVRAGVRALLDGESDLEVVGEADSGTHAIELARLLAPDIVITDLLFPDIDGVAVTESVRSELPDTKVLILTSCDDDDNAVARAVRAGAIGYVAKSGDVQLLAQTVRSSAAGVVHLPARSAARLVREIRAPEREPVLTCREQEVLREIAAGKSNKEIARSLRIAETTVKSHVQAILGKLGVLSRTQAVLLALRSHVLSQDDIQAA